MASESIPEDILARKGSIVIQEKSVKLTVQTTSMEVFYQEANPGSGAEEKFPPVFLMHGMRFKSQTWRDLGTMSLVAAAGHRVVAVDLPGYGNTPGMFEHPVEFLEAFTSATGLDRPLIVSPSMSGSYALPYLLADPSKASFRASGYIPVAPVNSEKFTKELYIQCPVPTLIVYGSDDKVLGDVSLANLSQLNNKKIVCFPDAGHACYLDKPDLWHNVLYEFLKSLE